MAETRWIGQINGARVGNLYWAEDDQGAGTISVGLSNGKNVRFFTRRDAGEPNKYHLEVREGDSAPQVVGHLKIEHGNQSMRAGVWSLNDGSAGTFELIIKVIGEQPKADNPIERSQVQIANKDVPLGAITLYRPDLDRVIAELETYFEGPVIPIIRAKEGDQVLVRNAAEYLSRSDLPDKIKEITIALETNAAHGLKKIVSLTLSDDLESKISISSPDELWTEAVSQRLSKYLKEFTGTFTGYFRRHGLTINSLLLLFLVVVLPEFALFERVVITGLTLTLMFLVVRGHKLVPFARIYLDRDRVRRPFAKELPSVILGGVATATAALITAIPAVTGFITRTIEAFATSFSSSFPARRPRSRATVRYCTNPRDIVGALYAPAQRLPSRRPQEMGRRPRGRGALFQCQRLHPRSSAAGSGSRRRAALAPGGDRQGAR